MFEDPVFIPGSGSLVAKSSPTTPHGHSLPGYSVRGISQARILEWVAISYSKRTFLKETR